MSKRKAELVQIFLQKVEVVKEHSTNFLFPFEKCDKAKCLFSVTFFPLGSRTENEPGAGTKCLETR